MHKVRQILIFLERGVSIRSIEKQVKISRKTIGLYQQKLLRTGLSLQELLLVKDQDLERLVSLEKAGPPEDTDPRKAHFYSQITKFNHHSRSVMSSHFQVAYFAKEFLATFAQERWRTFVRISIFSI